MTASDLNMKNISRRRFLQGSAASLVIGIHLPMLVSKNALASTSNEVTANAFIRIGSDNIVTVISKHIEFGQGTFTGLATLAAEELDADWSQVRAEHAPVDINLYVNKFFGIQGTGGSTAIASSYETMRKAGAGAKQLLVEAAAKKWRVSTDSITVSKGIVSHKASGKNASFGELVELAATLPLPAQEPKLKSADQFVLIGTEVPKLDTVDKSSGKAKYTQDLHFEDMVVAVVAHPPAFGAKVKQFDASDAKAVKGFIKAEQIAHGVAVFADTTFNAIKARRAIQVEWDFSEAETRSSEDMTADFKQALIKPGKQASKVGDISMLPGKKANTISVDFTFPFLAHAPMEPLDAVVLFKDNKATAWFGSQIPTIDQIAIAEVFGIEPAAVEINTMLAGGSFGRRTTQASEFAAEAAMAAKAFGKETPVKLVWTREDDIQGGRYRPMSLHTMKGEVDDNGNILGWSHKIATQSIAANSAFSALIVDGIDQTSVEGAHNQPYAVPNLDVQLHDMQTGVPVLWWRSVGHTHTGYAVETFIDTLLERVEKDPVKGRIELLINHPREANVLRVVGEMADKAGSVPPGRSRGVAMVKSFGSYVAQIVEISKGTDGMPKVHRAWCAVDCGIAVNTNIVKAQLEGGMGFGLDAILHGEISLGERGKVHQSNFHNYAVLRINEMPEIEVEVVKSAEAPTGVGEVGVPPIGPAVANAWRRLTGQYVTTLPFSKGIRTG